jgi:hypothetical protein
LRPMKAPPLLPSQVERLSDPEARLILGRWNARLRGLKRRAKDLAHQFPTSNVLVMFSKPFQTKRRRGQWYVLLFCSKCGRRSRFALLCATNRVELSLLHAQG